MTELRHACAVVAHLVERIGDETTPAMNLPALMQELRSAVARVETHAGLAAGTLRVGSLLGGPLAGFFTDTWTAQFGGDR